MEQMEYLKRLNEAARTGYFAVFRDALDQLESVFDQQRTTASDYLRRSVDGAEALLSVGDGDGMNRWQAEFAMPENDFGIRQQIDLAIKVQQELANSIQIQLTAFGHQASDILAEISEQWPSATKPLLDGMRSMMTMAGEAMENINKAGREMTAVAHTDVLVEQRVEGAAAEDKAA